jgi:hypothetical protein
VNERRLPSELAHLEYLLDLPDRSTMKPREFVDLMQTRLADLKKHQATFLAQVTVLKRK